MTPTESLIHEHQIILLVLKGLRKEAESIKLTGKINFEKVDKLIDFFQNFVDRCHHVKEERYLFPAMKKYGFFQEKGPILFLLEHGEMRHLVSLMVKQLPPAKMGQTQAVDEIATLFQNFIELLNRHIDREDHILFPTADEILPDQDKRNLETAFEKVETEDLGPGIHEKYHQLAHELGES